MRFLLMMLTTWFLGATLTGSCILLLGALLTP